MGQEWQDFVMNCMQIKKAPATGQRSDTAPLQELVHVI